MSVAVSRRVWESSRHNGATFTVLLALADYADDDGVAYPSVTALAKKARLSERMTQYAIGQLRRSGEVVVESGGGRHRTHRYIVVVPETTQQLHRFDDRETVQTTAERVQSASETVQTDAGKGAVVAPEPSPSNRQEPSPSNHHRHAVDPRIAEVYDYYREKIHPGSKTRADEKIRARLKTFTVAELKRGIDNFAADHWCMKNNARRPAAWFFHDDKRSETYLNMEPRQAVGGAAAAKAAPRPGSLAARTKSERFGG